LILEFTNYTFSSSNSLTLSFTTFWARDFHWFPVLFTRKVIKKPDNPHSVLKTQIFSLLQILTAMKYLFFLLLPLLFLACSKDNQPDPPSNFTVSKGTTVGVIRISFDKDPEVATVLIERAVQGSNNWSVITSTEGPVFDDSHQYPDGMPGGQVFEYRIQNFNGTNQGAEPYSAVETGYAYEFLAIDTLNFNRTTTSVNISWDKGNLDTFDNRSDLKFDVYRSTDSVTSFSMIATLSNQKSYTDDLTNLPNLQNVPLCYRVDVYYDFWATNPVWPTPYRFTTSKIQGVVNRVEP
jgi:hypothetical protein